MPATEYVLGFECDLTQVDDIAVQEAVFDFAGHLRGDNEHDRPLEHLADLLGEWAARVTAAAAMDGDYGKYLATLVDGRACRVEITTREARSRYDKVENVGIHVVCPQADAAGDPLFEGRLRTRLAAVTAAKRDDLPRLLRAAALADCPAEVRVQIYDKLTLFGGVAAEDALVHALVHDDDASIVPVIQRFVRRRPLLVRLPDELARAWSAGDRRTVARLTGLIPDMEFAPAWLAAIPRELAAEIERHMPKPPPPPADVSVAAAIDERLFAAATTGEPFERMMAVKRAADKRRPTHVPTFIAALAHPGNARGAATDRDAKKYLPLLRSELYTAMSFHEAQLVRDALLAGLRDEPDDVAERIIYVAWRQELLLARLPEYVLAAWQHGDVRYVDRLREIWRTHAGHVATPNDWPDELRKRR